MDVHDRGMLYYRLLKHDVKEAQKVVCGQAKTVAEENTVTHRVSHSLPLIDKKNRVIERILISFSSAVSISGVQLPCSDVW